MPKIAGIIKDTELTGADTLIGSEALTDRTVNIPLSALSSFIGDGDSSLTQTRIEEAITDNQGFRSSIGAVNLDYLTESVESQADTTVTTNGSNNNIGSFGIRITRINGIIAVGSIVTWEGVEYLIRNSLPAQNSPFNISTLNITLGLEAVIPDGTVLTVTAPILTTIESHIALPYLPHVGRDLSFGQLYSSGGVVQIAGDTERSGNVTIRAGVESATGVSTSSAPNLVLELNTSLSTFVNPVSRIATHTEDRAGEDDFVLSEIVTITEDDGNGTERGSVAITVANAGDSARWRAPVFGTPTSGISHKFTATGIETNGIIFLQEGPFPAGNIRTSNTLDDYEEGTWEPEFQNPPSTLDYSLGVYNKVGNLVTITLSWRHDNSPLITSTNEIIISGLPFNPIRGISFSGTINLTDSASEGVGIPFNGFSINTYHGGGSATYMDYRGQTPTLTITYQTHA